MLTYKCQHTGSHSCELFVWDFQTRGSGDHLLSSAQNHPQRRRHTQPCGEFPKTACNPTGRTLPFPAISCTLRSFDLRAQTARNHLRLIFGGSIAVIT